MTTSSKKNSTPARLRPPTTSSSPSPSVSTVNATGQSSFPDDSQSPARKTSKSSLASAAARSGTTTPQNERNNTPGDFDDFDNLADSRRSWFNRKSTWSLTSQKPAPEREATCSAGTPEVQPQTLILNKKSNAKLNDDYLKRSASATSLYRPSRMNPTPPTVAPPQATPAPVPTPQPEPESEQAPESESTPEEPSRDDAAGTVGSNTTSGPDTTAGQSAGWFAWWYGSPAQPEPTSQPTDTKEPEPEPVKEPEVQPPHEDPVPLPDDQKPVGEAAHGEVDSVAPPQSRGWFGWWGGDYPPMTAAESAKSTEPAETTATKPLEPASTAANPPKITVEETPPADRISSSASAPDPDPAPAPSYRGYGYGYGWGSWWSSSKEVEPTAAAGNTIAEGEVAVAGTSSESNPQKAKIKLPAEPQTPRKAASNPLLQSEATFPDSKASIKTPSSDPKKSKSKGTPSIASQSTSETVSGETSAAKKKLEKIVPQNHVFPAFESCYRPADQPSIFQRFTGVLRHQQPPKDHLYIARQPPRIKKAVAIGVHGFFPMRLVRTVLGEPTGTSRRFANHAAAAIKRWAEQNGVEVEVENIALEGEGKVADRVDMLWKLLENWMDHVKSADFVLMAAHSQGVVVGMQLLARLIEEGCVDRARLGLIGMAGINLGPFGHLPTTLLTGSARELFEFQKQDSGVSKKYIQALRTVLAHNVRILYVGSIDDQLVPLESSTITNISHPYIYRAVFVDGRVHAPDFLSHLVGFAMKLRNLGVSDHGLIRELSSPLAGSLYGGEGHSRIYDDIACYDLGVRHALETTDCPDVPLKVQPFELPTNGNPYFLPWSLRGMLEETLVRSKLAAECGQLLEQFDNWKPTSKTLKDVKFRLEGIKSKL